MIKQASDNRFYGFSAIEVVGFSAPELINSNYDEAFNINSRNFNDLVSNIASISVNDDLSLEMLLVSQPVDNQAYKAKIRVFLIVRTYSPNRNYVEGVLTNSIDLIRHTLEKSKYSLVQNDDAGSFITGINTKSIISVVKNETVYTDSTYAYDILKTDSRDNMEALFSQLSMYPNSAVSFSIIPTRLNQNEQFALNGIINYFETVRMQNNVHHDFPQEMPVKYTIRNQNQPHYFYNLIVFGNESAAINISASLKTMLSSGEIENATCDLRHITMPSNHSSRVSLANMFYNYPWKFNEYNLSMYRARELYDVPVIAQLGRMPFLMTKEEIGVFFRLPFYSSNTAYIPARLGAETNVKIPENLSSTKDSIIIGKQDGTGAIVCCPLNVWTKHTTIVGMPGSGKTTFAESILYQFYKKNIPFLVIEPTKTEYRELIKVIPDLRVFTPGKDDVSPFIINPFIPPKNVTLSVHKTCIKEALIAALGLTSPLDTITGDAVDQVYVKHGWNDNSKLGDLDVRPFGFRELIAEFKDIMDHDANYGDKQVKTRIQTAGFIRLKKLIQENPNVYDTINTISTEDIFSRPTILELSHIRNSEHRTVMLSLILANIRSYVDARNVSSTGNEPLRNIIMIDEAHVLLNRSEGVSVDDIKSTSMVEQLASIAAEMRSLGVGLIVADQKPSKITNDILANCATKISFLLQDKVEKDLIASVVDISEYNKNYFTKLTTGQAFFYTANKPPLDNPIMVQTPNVREKFERISPPTINDNYLVSKIDFWKGKEHLLKPYNDCTNICKCDKCDSNLKNKARQLAKDLYLNNRQNIRGEKTAVSAKKMVAFCVSIPNKLSGLKSFSGLDDKQKKKLVNCVTIMFYNEVELRTDVKVPDDVKNKIKELQGKAL